MADSLDEISERLKAGGVDGSADSSVATGGDASATAARMADSLDAISKSLKSAPPLVLKPDDGYMLD